MKLHQLTLVQALEGLQAGQFTSAQLTQACLDQIHQTDTRIHAYLNLNPNALAEAEAADKIIDKLGKKAFQTQSLLGIPYALKDNFCTNDFKTTASAKVLDQFVPQFDATVVTRLRQAGAIILGKTNMDAWAHGSSTETSDYGPTYNPWNTKHLPGGSSGGSAAAVAADQCIFAIGSETAGSIRQPAAWCGVTGLKPTYGRVSRYGVVAMKSSTDSPGPITKTVEDALLVTQVIAGHDVLDGTTSPLPVKLNLSELPTTLKGLTIGVPSEYMPDQMDPQVVKAVQQAITQLEDLGAAVKPITLMDPKYAIAVYTIAQRSEVSSNLGRYQAVRYGVDRSEFGAEAKRRIMLGTFALSTGYYDQYYNQAQKVRTLLIEDYKQAFKEVDLIVGPVSPSVADPVGATAGESMYGEMQDMLVEASSIAGLTGTSVPCGFVDGLPVGLQITGPQFAEQLVLNVSYAYQQSTQHHKKKPQL